MPTVLGKLHSSFTAPHPFWSFCPTRLVLFARYASWGHGSSGKCCSPLFHRVPCLFRGRDARKQKTHRDLAGTLHLKRHATRAGVARVPGNTYDPYLTPPPGKKGDVDAGDLSEIGGTTGSFPPSSRSVLTFPPTAVSFPSRPLLVSARVSRCRRSSNGRNRACSVHLRGRERSR